MEVGKKLRLCRKVCESCINRHSEEDLKWDEDDDENWLRNYVQCPFLYGGIAVSDGAPLVCPYLTEHVVSQDSAIEER